MFLWPATQLMPLLEKAEFLAFPHLYDDPGWVLLYKWEYQFLNMRSMFLDGDTEIV